MGFSFFQDMAKLSDNFAFPIYSLVFDRIILVQNGVALWSTDMNIVLMLLITGYGEVGEDSERSKGVSSRWL